MPSMATRLRNQILPNNIKLTTKPVRNKFLLLTTRKFNGRI